MILRESEVQILGARDLAPGMRITVPQVIPAAQWILPCQIDRIAQARSITVISMGSVLLCFECLSAVYY